MRELLRRFDDGLHRRLFESSVPRGQRPGAGGRQPPRHRRRGLLVERRRILDRLPSTIVVLVATDLRPAMPGLRTAVLGGAPRGEVPPRDQERRRGRAYSSAGALRARARRPPRRGVRRRPVAECAVRRGEGHAAVGAAEVVLRVAATRRSTAVRPAQRRGRPPLPDAGHGGWGPPPRSRPDIAARRRRGGGRRGGGVRR